MTDSRESRRAFIKASLAASSVVAAGTPLRAIAATDGHQPSDPKPMTTQHPPAGERFHPVFDFNHWRTLFPLSSFERHDGPRKFRPDDPDDHVDLWRPAGRMIGSPDSLVCMEQVRAAAARDHALGRAVPMDVFVWEIDELNRAHKPDRPWLTRIGGSPWRPADRPWPKEGQDRPLVFLAQISFIDSKDLFDFELPGDVLLIFADVDGSELWDEGSVQLEWSPRHIPDPWEGRNCPSRSMMPLVFNGVIHRTANFPDSMKIFDDLGHYRSHYINELQATAIGTRARFPQGWPFEDRDGNTLIAVLSDFSPSFNWPFVNMEFLPQRTTRPRGIPREINRVFGLGIQDAGCLYVYRDKAGQIHHAMTSM